MTRKEKRIKVLKEKLSIFESKLYKTWTDYTDEITESVSSKINHQDSIMLSFAIEDLKEEISKLES